MSNNKHCFKKDISDKACRCYISERALFAARERQRLLTDTTAISEVISEMVLFAYHELKKQQKINAKITSHVTPPPTNK